MNLKQLKQKLKQAIKKANFLICNVLNEEIKKREAKIRKDKKVL